MPRTAWLALIADSRLVRRAADAGFVQVAHHRVKQLDRLNVAKVQEATLLRLVRLARDTRFGRDHDIAAIRTIEDYQAQGYRLYRIQGYSDSDRFAAIWTK